MRAFQVVALFFLVLAIACTVERAAAPGLFVMDDVGAGQWRTVSTGAEHSCALDAEGRAYCWGRNQHHQLGVQRAGTNCGSELEAIDCALIPVPIASGRRFRSVSAGGSHTCAISADSVPFCWGNNSSGQLGTLDPASPYLRIPGTLTMLAISAGAAHSCGIRTDNVLVCWGSNTFGAVGAGSGSSIPPTPVGGNQRFASVEASDHRTCARTLAGRVMCWGATWVRTSGDTNYSAVRSTLTFVAGLGAMSAIGVGSSSTCSVDVTGFAWCWETNLHGESGTGPGNGTTTPRRVASDAEFKSVTVGSSHACGIDASGAALCWGNNRSGQLGAMSTEYCSLARSFCTTRPAVVSGRQRFVSLSAGLGSHVCGVTDRHNLYCWGAGSSGQRGDGTQTAGSRVPRLVTSD